MVIELRSSSPAGRVVAIPLGRAASRTGLRYRSTVAALIVMSSSNVDPSYVELPARAQHGQPLGQHRLQVLAARHVHHHPHLAQQLPRAVRIPPRTLRGDRLVMCSPSGLGEQAPRGAPADSERFAHPVQDDALLLLRRPHVLVPEPDGDLPLRRHADPVFHKTSQTNQPGFALTFTEAPLRNSRSKT